MRLGEYEPAVLAGRRAQALRNSLISDPPFMYAVARAYAGVGNIKVAEMTLQMLRQETAAEHGNAEWHDGVNFIAAQIKAGNQKELGTRERVRERDSRIAAQRYELNATPLIAAAKGAVTRRRAGD